MKIHKKVTESGLTLQAIEMPGTSVVTTLILCGAGSRYEDLSISGISHFLEHMFFKGAKKYPTPKSVSQAVDKFGGEFNAFTGKEYAGYYVKAGRTHMADAIDVLSDMLLHSRFDEAEINKERGVILEEMAMYLDAPMYQISWDLEKIIFGDQPLGRDQIGTRELINGVNQQMFKDYQKELYTPDNMVITISGAVNEKDLEDLEKAFPFEKVKRSREIAPFDEKLATKKVHHRKKKTEQFHLNFGVRGVSEASPDYMNAKVLAVALGGNMSSRMWQNVREDKGLCYSIRTYVEEFTDTGLLTTRAGVKLSDAKRAILAIRGEYDRVAKNGLTEEELVNAKSYLAGRTDLQTEDTEDVAHHFGKGQLLYGKGKTYAEVQESIKKVTLAGVNALAKKLFSAETYRLAAIGGDMTEDEIKELIS